MKKIVYIANLRLPTEKAYGIQIAKMCEAFASQDMDVTLAYPSRKNLEKGDIFSYYSLKNNFRVMKIGTRDFYLPGFLDKIAFFIKNYFSAKALIKESLKENADIYYTRDELVAYLLSNQSKNVIFECHRFSNKRKLFYSHFKKINLKIVTISDGLKEDLVKFGIKDSNIRVERDGVDLDEFKVVMSKEDARKKFFKNIHWESFSRKKIAVYIGHLYNWKGVNVNIFSEVAKYLCDKNPNFIVGLFGGTDKDNKKLKEDITKIKKELIKNLENVHPSLVPMIYIQGRVPHKEVPYILKAADCAILTGNESDTISAKYTSPLKMFEYMASGCPIVAQDLPSFREVLNDSNSFLVKPGDAKALADQIALVFDNNVKMVEERAARARKALEDVKQYTWQERSRKILNFII